MVTGSDAYYKVSRLRTAASVGESDEHKGHFRAAGASRACGWIPASSLRITGRSCKQNRSKQETRDGQGPPSCGNGGSFCSGPGVQQLIRRPVAAQ